MYRRPVPQGTLGGGGEFWAILLLSLQRLMNYPVHLGGASALDLAGHAHYLNLGGTPRVHFYGDVPSWLKRLPTPTKIVVRRSSLFGDDPVGIEEFDVGAGTVLDIWRWPISASSPERAILEALDELPRHASFDNLDKVFEGLVSLRPRQLTALLHACRSVKVRRLFFVFADRHGHGWRQHLDASTIDFGSGPRPLSREAGSTRLRHLRARNVDARRAPSDGQRCLTATWHRSVCCSASCVDRRPFPVDSRSETAVRWFRWLSLL